MDMLSIVAAGGSADLLVGLLIGCCIGVLVGPAFRAWQIHREWTDASREAGLADQLLERMEIDDLVDDLLDPRSTDDDPLEPTWRTPR